MNDCPSCGASLRYDIESEMLVCDHCTGRFNPEEYDAAHTWQQRQGTRVQDEYADAAAAVSEEGALDGGDGESSAGKRYRMTVYTCPSCGAQIMATDESAVEYCSFCGTFVMLESHQTDEKMPDYIIPFRKTKEECKEIYRKKIRSNPFAPRELKDPDYLNRFSGFYIPYWVYDIGFAKNPRIRGYKEHREGDYDVKEKFVLTGDLSASYAGLVYDASSIFDDNISERIAPFGTAKMKEFTPSYMFGFFADQSDVDSAVYSPDARKLATEQVISSLMSESGIRKYTLESTTDSALQREMGTRIQSIRSAMLPVWFLTWRKNDRIAYSVVNGETGKIYAEIPIDPKRFLLGSLLLSIPIFLLFNLFLVLTPQAAMACTALIAPLAMLMYVEQLGRIRKRQEGAGNKGAASVRKGAQSPMSMLGVKASSAAAGGAGNGTGSGTRKKKAKKENRTAAQNVGEGLKEYGAFLRKYLKQAFQGPGEFVQAAIVFLSIGAAAVFAVFGAGFFVSALIGGSRFDLQLILYLLLVPCWGWLMYLNWSSCSKLKRSGVSLMIPLLCGILGLILPAIIKLLSPVADWWYYGGCVCSLVSAVIALLMALMDYNESVTRETPKFFTKAKEERR